MNFGSGGTLPCKPLRRRSLANDCSVSIVRLAVAIEVDPSAAADRRIRRRKFVRRKSAEKITARRISHPILLTLNSP